MRREVLRVVNLSLSSGVERVFSNLAFRLFEGEILGVVGVNGVGKTMLAQVLAGLIAPDGGDITLDGKTRVSTRRGMLSPGIGYVGEEPQLLRNLTVADNLAIGIDSRSRLYGSRRALWEWAGELLERYHFKIDPRTPVSALSFAQAKEVQIARQLAAKPRVLILDEFADSFSDDQLSNLREIFERVTAQGTAMVYTAHNYEDVLRFASRVLVLRSTAFVAEFEREEFDRELIKRIMYHWDSPPSGSPAVTGEQAPVSAGVEVFRAEDIRAGDMGPVSLRLCQGEILGVAGLVGSGKSILSQCIGGQRPAESGALYVDGARCVIRSPRDAIRSGIGLCMEKRAEMLSVEDTVAMNITMGIVKRLSVRGVLSRRREELLAREYCQRLNIRPQLRQKLSALNNAAVCKIAIAKCLAANPRVLVMDEPNRELDREGVFHLCEVLEELRAACGILLIFSKIDDLAQLCDRVLVMNRGIVIGELSRGRVSYNGIVRLMEERGGDRFV